MSEQDPGHARILIVRLSALGDTALTLPLLAILRQTFPHAHIGWLVGQGAAPLLEGIPELDEIHVFHNADKSFRGYLHKAKVLKGFRYDIAIDTQGLTKSALLPWLAGIKQRIGFRRAPLDARELAPLLNNKLVSPPKSETNVAMRMAWLASALNITPSTPLPPITIPINRESMHMIDTWWNEKNLADNVIIFGIGAGWSTKIWNVHEMAALTKHAKKQGLQPVILWGPPEKEKLSEWQTILGDSAIFAPPTNIHEMLALIAKSRALCGPDSASLHFAWLLQKPTLSWFGPSDPARCAPPVTDQNVVIAMPPHDWNRKDPSTSGLNHLTGTMALPAFTKWLADSNLC